MMLLKMLISIIIGLLMNQTENELYDARKSAAKDSAYAYLDSAELYIAMNMMYQTSSGTVADEYSENVTDGKCSLDGSDCKWIKSLNATIKGTIPDEGFIKITNSSITDMELHYGDYVFTLSDLQGE